MKANEPHGYKKFFFVLLLLLTITLLVVGGLYLNNAVLTRVGISLEIIGGLLAAPDILVFVLGNERLERYDKNVDAYISEVTEILAVRTKTYRSLLRFSWFPEEDKSKSGNFISAFISKAFGTQDKDDEEIVADTLSGCAYYLFIYQSTCATSLWSILVLVYWILTKETVFALNIGIGITVTRLIFQIQVELLDPLLHKQKLYKPISALFGGIHWFFLIPIKIIELIFQSINYIAAGAIFIMETGVEYSSILKPKAKKNPQQRRSFSEILEKTRSTSVIEIIMSILYNLGYPVKWLGDITIFTISNLIAFIPQKIFLYLTYPFRIDQADKYGLLVGFVIVVTGNVMQFIATWK